VQYTPTFTTPQDGDLPEFLPPECESISEVAVSICLGKRRIHLFRDGFVNGLGAGNGLRLNLVLQWITNTDNLG